MKETELHVVKLDDAENLGKRSPSVNSISVYPGLIDFHWGSVKRGRKCREIFGGTVGRILTVVGCCPEARFCNDSLTRLTTLITSVFVPGLFLRKIVGPSAIFILSQLSRSYDQCVARSTRVETITTSPRFPSIDVRPRATIRPTPAMRRVKPSSCPDCSVWRKDVAHALSRACRAAEAWRKKWILYF